MCAELETRRTDFVTAISDEVANAASKIDVEYLVSSSPGECVAGFLASDLWGMCTVLEYEQASDSVVTMRELVAEVTTQLDAKHHDLLMLT